MQPLCLVLVVLACTFAMVLSKKPSTCREAYFQGSTKTGIKKLKHDGYKFKAFCIYNEDGTGWFYPSKQAVTDNNTFTLNLDDQYDSRDVARVRIFFEDGSQKDSTMEQLSTHTSRNLTFMVNSADGFQGPANTNRYSPNYLYLGFLPRSVAAARTLQGWRADGTDITFTNCDANPNSYYAFYDKNTYTSSPYGLGSNYATANTWRAGVNNLDPVADDLKIPSKHVEDFKFGVEFHFGGCGVIEVSSDWSTKTSHSLNSNGGALGLKFDLDNRCGPEERGVCMNCSQCNKVEPRLWKCKGAKYDCSFDKKGRGKMCCCMKERPEKNIRKQCKK